MLLVTWPCRNAFASGPVSASLPRSERSTSPHASVRARYPAARLSAIAVIRKRGYAACLLCSGWTSVPRTSVSPSERTRGSPRASAEPVPATGEALAERVAAIARELAGGEPIAAAAVGMPGIPEGDAFAGLIAGAAGLTGAPLRRLLADALAAPVAFDNDVNLAALAESRARGVDDLAFIAVGTGVGMGIVSDGRVLRGAARRGR